MNRLIRRPSPDLTTACATRNAITTNRTLALAKPPKACAGVIVPVRTTAATAIMVEVNSGNAPTSTAAIAATNTAKRCHAGAVSPAGTGVNQIPSARAKGNARLISKPELIFIAGLLHQAWLAPNLRGCVPFRPIDWPCTVPSSRLQYESPGEFITAQSPRSSARCRRGMSHDMAAGRCALAFQFAEDLVAAIVGPDGAANRAVAVSLSTSASARKPTPGREGPASTSEPSSFAMEARLPSPNGMLSAVAGSSPGPLELVPFVAGRRD